MRILISGVLALFMVGCCGTLSRETAYHEGVKEFTLKSGLLDEYEAYVAADPKIIKEDTRKIRKGTAQDLRKLIATEEAALQKK